MFSKEGYRRIDVGSVVYDYINQAQFWVDDQGQFHYDRQLPSWATDWKAYNDRLTAKYGHS